MPVGPSVSCRHIFRQGLVGTGELDGLFFLSLFDFCAESGNMQIGLEKLRKLLEFFAQSHPQLHCSNWFTDVPFHSLLLSDMIVYLGCVLDSMCSNSVWREPITAAGFLPTEATGSP